MWDRIKMIKKVEKTYGKLTRLASTMYECVGMIAHNHLEKRKVMKELKVELDQQQRQMIQLQTKLLELEDSLREESELASSIYSLCKDMTQLTKKSSLPLQQIQTLIEKEEESSSDIWKTLHGEKALLHESIRLLGKALKKSDSLELMEQEKQVEEWMNNISTMITKKTNEEEMK